MDKVSIHGRPDQLKGLADRLYQLALRVERNGSDHDHLMTPSWGGEELEEELQSSDGSIINHLVIYCWGK